MGLGREVRRAVACWLVWAASIWAIALLVGLYLPPEGRRSHPRTPTEVLSAWDGAHYAHIAREGYSPEGLDRLRYAFFPLLPALSRLLGGRGHAPLAGILLAQLCTLAAALLLQRVERARNGDAPIPLLEDPAFWLVASPCSFFLGAFYTESLFILLSLLMATSWRQGRGVAAGISGFFAGLARPTAICLPALLLPGPGPWRRLRALRPAALVVAAAPLAGLGLYVLYTGFALRHPLGYTFIMKIWGRHLTVPFLPLVRDVTGLLGLPDVWSTASTLRPEEMALRLFSTLGIAALVATGWKRLEPGDLFYLLLSFAFIHSQEPNVSTPRYEMALFPVYLLLARSGLGRLKVPLAVLFVLCQALLLVRHGSWLWVG